MERTDNDRASSSLSILGTASPEMNREHHETYSLFNLYTRATFITTGYWYFVYYMYYKGGKWELQFLSPMTQSPHPPVSNQRSYSPWGQIALYLHQCPKPLVCCMSLHIPLWWLAEVQTCWVSCFFVRAFQLQLWQFIMIKKQIIIQLQQLSFY